MPDSTPDYEKLIADYERWEQDDAPPEVTNALVRKQAAAIEALQGEVTRLTREVEAAKSSAREYMRLKDKAAGRADAAEEVAEQYRAALELLRSTSIEMAEVREISSETRGTLQWVKRSIDDILRAKPTGELTRLRTQRAALIKAWDAWYDPRGEAMASNDLIEAMVALKEEAL